MVSILAIVLTVTFGVVAAAMGFMMIAFTDSCPPETCSIDTAVTAMLGGLAVAVVVGLVGSVWTIVRLVRRRRAWPLAVGMMVMCGTAFLTGFVGYLAAVGGI